jgi:hypothetical protein
MRKSIIIAMTALALVALTGCSTPYTDGDGEKQYGFKAIEVTVIDGRVIPCIKDTGSGGISCDWSAR